MLVHWAHGPMSAFTTHSTSSTPLTASGTGRLGGSMAPAGGGLSNASGRRSTQSHWQLERASSDCSALCELTCTHWHNEGGTIDTVTLPVCFWAG